MLDADDGFHHLIPFLAFLVSRFAKFASMRARLKIQNDTIMLTVSEYDEATVCATGNIPNLVLRRSGTVNVYELLRFKKLVFSKDALDAFIGRLA